MILVPRRGNRTLLILFINNELERPNFCKSGPKIVKNISFLIYTAKLFEPVSARQFKVRLVTGKNFALGLEINLIKAA